MRSLCEGQAVSLKPGRADAYGLDRDAVFTVDCVFQRPGYKALWCRVRELDAPYNVLKASDLR